MLPSDVEEVLKRKARELGWDDTTKPLFLVQMDKDSGACNVFEITDALQCRCESRIDEQGRLEIVYQEQHEEIEALPKMRMPMFGVAFDTFYGKRSLRSFEVMVHADNKMTALHVAVLIANQLTADQG